MAILAATDHALWIAKYAFQPVTKSVGLSMVADLKDSTVMGNTWRARTAGLRGVGVQIGGLWDSTADLGQFSAILGTSCPVTVSATSTVGSVAYVFLAAGADYQPGAQVGELFGFTAGAQGNGIVARGQLMENSTRTATANGTGAQLGALSSTQSMYVNLHVPATVSGTSPTLDVTIQSAAANTFVGATTRATFTQLTAEGSQQKIITGAVTDTWWRAVMTIGGSSTPTFPIAIAMGIA
jgi:hypothetical protein